MTSICLVFNHGGILQTESSKTYVNGKIKKLMVDIETLTVPSFYGTVLSLGYENVGQIYWKKSECSLDKMLDKVSTDEDIVSMFRYINEGGTRIDVYVDHTAHCPFPLAVEGFDQVNIQEEDDVQPNVCVDLEVDEANSYDYSFSADEYLTDDADDELQAARDKIRSFNRKGSTDGIHEVNVDVDTSRKLMTVYDVEEEEKSTDDDGKVSSCESEYFDTGDEDSYYTSDDLDDEEHDDALRRKSNIPRYDINTSVPTWTVGMIFLSMEQFKNAVLKYAVDKGRNLKWKKNEPKRVRVECVDGCKFVLLCSWCSTTNSFRLKTYYPHHSCSRSNKLTIINQYFIADHFKERIKAQPDIKISELKRLCKYELKIHVNLSKCKRAKKIVINEIEGDYLDVYSKLYDYAEALRESNPGSTIILETDRRSPQVEYFERFYVCFKSCMDNWTAGCRPIIGLDGCFLKGKCKGQLLCAVGRDANNQMFPIAWAVVKVENTENWMWFCNLLSIDIYYTDHATLTIISDMQKGLINVVRDIFPSAEHRLCARHVYHAWQKKWRGEELKKLFWRAAKSTYTQMLDATLAEMEKIAKGSAEALCTSYSLQTWCKAYFQTSCQSDIVDNNLSETFNGWILEARCKPIITMLEEIRVMVMNRLRVKREWHHKWKQDFAPKVVAKVEANKEKAMACYVEWNGDDGFEVVDSSGRHVILLSKHSCTCRSWDLTGIPCPHAISAIWNVNKDPYQYVSSWYHKNAYKKSYLTMLQPMKDSILWRKTTNVKVMPPPYRSLPGRPKKRRRKDKDEPKKKSKVQKLPRKGRKMSCSICAKIDHNKKCCPTQRSISTKGCDTQTKMKQKVGEGFGCLVSDSGQSVIMCGSSKRVLKSNSSSSGLAMTPKSTFSFLQSGMQFRGNSATITKKLNQELVDKRTKRTKKNIEVQDDAFFTSHGSTSTYPSERNVQE